MQQPYEQLTKRYRPTLLDHFVGQDHVVAQLKGMLSTGRVAQTIMFSGAYGSGKTSFARVLARYLNCMDPQPEDVCTDDPNAPRWVPCGQCYMCQNPDVDVIEINGTVNRKIDDVRSMLETIDLAPQSNRRVYIIDEVQGYTKDAISAVLKAFEEPPTYTVFVLCTTDPQKLPETILSRCMRFEIKNVELLDCARLLKRVAENEGLMNVPNEMFIQIAQRVRAHPRTALQALEGVLFYVYGKGPEAIANLMQQDQLNALLENTVSLPNEQFVFKWVSSVMSGQYTGALLVCKATPDPMLMLEDLIEYCTQTAFWQISDKLQDACYRDYYVRLQQFEEQIRAPMPYWQRLPNDLWAEILVILTEAFSESKSYLVDSRLLLNAATLKIIQKTSYYQTCLYQNYASQQGMVGQ